MHSGRRIGARRPTDSLGPTLSTLVQLGIQVRAGLHAAECEVADGKVAGIAVSIGAGIASTANPSEVLVSSTVKDLVAGSGLTFDARGRHELEGVPGKWRLYSVVAST